MDIFASDAGEITVKIQLFEQQGRLLQEAYASNLSANTPFRLNLENYKPGMYILSITAASSHYATKIILY